MDNKVKYAGILFGALVLLGLYLTSRTNYLLFHSLAELFSIIVAIGIFALAWHTRRSLANNYILFIGIAYLFVGGIDLLHTLGYTGMGVFTGYGTNLPTELWIAARYIESLSLFIAPLFIGRKLNANLAFIGYALVTALLLVSIFTWNIFPDSFIEGTGLTAFKKTSEYVISAILLGSLYLLFRKRTEFDKTVFRLLTASIIVTIGSELLFTLYTDPFGTANLAGHILKIISFYLIYKAIIETGLVKPFNLLLGSLAEREVALRESGEQYSALVRNLADAVFMVKQGVITWCNDSVEKVYGYTKDEIIGKEASFFYPEHVSHPDFVQAVSTSLREHGLFLNTTTFQKKDGSTIDIEYSVSQIPEVNPPTVIAVARDVTERKQAQEMIAQALNESRHREAEISALLEGSRAVLSYRQFRDAAQSIFDYCKNLIGATAGYIALLSKDGAENEVLFLDSGGLPCTVDTSLPMPVRGLRAETYNTGKAVYENDFAHSKWIDFMPEGHANLDNVLFAPLIIDDKVVGLLGLANKPSDFTENDARIAAAFGELAAIALRNSRSLESLEESEERFRSVVETAGDAIISIGSDGKTIYWNRAAENVFGYTADEVLGKPISSLIVPERFHSAHLKGLQRVVSTGETRIVGNTVELEGRKKDGSEFPLELTLATWKTGEGTFFTAIIRDITERKELDQLKDEFIGLVSHELRSPLTVVIGAVNTALTEGKRLSEDDTRQLLQDAAQEADSLSYLLGNLLELSRAQADRLVLYVESMHIGSVIEELLQKMRARYPSHQFIANLPDDLPLIPADKLRVERILYNLLENAVKYSPAGSKIHVFVQPEKRKLAIGVRDEGIGISSENQAMLFQPFQRSEDAMRAGIKGIGLGLLVCRRLVEAHGGRIWLESEPGHGTTFFFTLPSG